MASTTLFAPQVRAVQPAFEYATGKAKIYFSLSPYDTFESGDLIEYTLIDPNLASGWGEDSMITSQTDTTSFTYDSNSGEYYFEINFRKTKTNADTGEVINIFKTLNTNQFYQMQLYYCRGENKSEPSQPTLIRPIDKGAVEWFLPQGYTIQNSVIKGKIKYDSNDTTEAIASYRYTVSSSSGSYSSVVIYNDLGVNFEIQLIEEVYLALGSGTTFTLSLDYTTIHGFEGASTITYALGSSTENSWTNVKSVSISLDPAAAANKLTIEFEDELSGTLTIERTDEYSNFNIWHPIGKIDFRQVTSIEWKDYYIEAGREYKYRIKNQQNRSYTTDPYLTPIFYDLFFIDNTQQFALRYNPVISNFKYVTQDSITNTLGNRYPIIRKNGDTKYRQFNVTGTVACIYENWNGKVKDSIAKSAHSFQADRDSLAPMYFSNEIQDNIKLRFRPSYFTFATKKELINNTLKEIVREYLTNGRPKLFKSFSEGNMIVYLSNISFTPNKQLDRSVMDFSATVTELCENTFANRERYGLTNSTFIDSHTLIGKQEEEAIS